MKVLSELTGLPFDDLALSAISALQLKLLRVASINYAHLCDSQQGRVTVSLNKETGLIESISKERQIDLLGNIEHERDFRVKLLETQQKISGKESVTASR
ncbi:MAG: hypothetical protein QXN55_00695 [Candidatus Nitrosotenuis sp.]